MDSARRADDDADRPLIEWLLERGVSADAIAEARQLGEATHLAGDWALRLGPRVSLRAASEDIGIPAAALDRIRRAAQLTPRDLDEPFFTLDEVASFKGIASQAGMFTPAEADHFARVIGSSLSRIADAAVSLFIHDVELPARSRGKLDKLAFARENLRAVEALESVGSAMGPLLRLHLYEAIERNRHTRTQHLDLALLSVGFVDLVGFTSMTEHIDPHHLGELIRDFEATAYDAVTDHGGRVVKMIGDEVMFISPSPEDACSIAISLISGFADRPIVTPRGGIAYGELLPRGGDYYGPVVNMASRIADLAVPHEVLVTAEVAAAAGAHRTEPAGRRVLKGFADAVEVFSLARSQD